MYRVRFFALGVSLCLTASFSATSQQAGQNATYQQLRTLTAGSEVITVSNLELHRDAATLTFAHGDFALMPAVNGKVTGAVFRGQGHIHVTPPNAEERHNLMVLNRAEQFDEDFDQAVLRFTDGTLDELKKASTGKGQPDGAFAQEVTDLRNFQRHKLGENFDLRILEDVLSNGPGGFFLAAVHGKDHPHLVFTVDPNGARGVAPEEVSLGAWQVEDIIYLTAFRAQGLDPDAENSPYRIAHEDLDTTIEKNGFLTGAATVQVSAAKDGVAVVPLSLYPTLRVSKVTDDKGKALDFVQENKDEDADFGVVLATPLKKGESATMQIAYAGKNVVENEGNENYYLNGAARQSWYPNAADPTGNFVNYNMQFHVPKGLDLIATGNKVSESADGKMTTTVWKTEEPLADIGFNLGRFKMKDVTLSNKAGDKLTIAAYANAQVPDNLAAINQAVSAGDPSQQDVAIGQLNPLSMLPTQLGQGQVAAQIYTSYFGPLPFNHVAVMQQYACNYGQSWPMLVYLPICGFLDVTQQHALGLHPEDMYWKTVTAHEVAHQWWGQTVGWRSYRDQWMSEGFADASASLFLQSTRGDADYRAFWAQQQTTLLQKNVFEFRPVDVGPVTMGTRLMAPKTGWDVYQNLVYPKGAYILHMIRRMMWSPAQGDSQFIALMTDFAKTYRMRSASTEDFKAMVEKHMTPNMDLEGNHRMDWFFNEFVYGTQVPTYHFEAEMLPGNTPGGTLHFKLTQSNVPDDFKSLVPMYIEFSNGKVLRLGVMPLYGDKTLEQSIPLPQLPAAVKKVVINYDYDVLSNQV